ncbi:MAG: glycosyltransferase family 4 protein [Candidatus Hydrogenedentes bacterium]|nr:glycosyltransferase family 4 protein [Candidatus Hydrogenedentota bacterium]
MRVVFFGNECEQIAAIRYRAVKFARMLEKEGHACTLCLPSSIGFRERYFVNASKPRKLFYLACVLLRRIAQLRHVPGADVVYFRGPLYYYGPPFLEYLVCAMNPRVVFDIDDAIWEAPAHVDSFFVRFMDFGWVRKMAQRSAHAVVGNQHLKNYILQQNPALPVTIIPTCIDMEIHTPKTAKPGTGAVCLGWTGLKDNLGYMKPIEPVFQRLAQKHPIKISVATGKPWHLKGVQVENHYWELKDEITYLKEADIGLMPLQDTPRARGKCAFKALQYMAVGVPPVITPVGMNAEVIEDGVNGFLATSPEEWEAKLERLITDPELRARMGAAARETVIARYSHDVFYPVFRGVMESVAAMRRRNA